MRPLPPAPSPIGEGGVEECAFRGAEFTKRLCNNLHSRNVRCRTNIQIRPPSPMGEGLGERSQEQMKTTGLVRYQHIREEKLDLARSMRKTMTNSESLLWEKLRREQLGVKFRRQQIIEGFIADFYCEKIKLVIEVDGSVHDTPEQKEYDAHRSRVFEARGLQEIRFRNSEVECDIDGVVDRIRNVVRNNRTS